MCTEQIIVVAVNMEARQLGNGVENLHATGNQVKILRLQRREGKAIYCCFTEIRRKILAEVLCQIHSQIIITAHNIFDQQGA